MVGQMHFEQLQVLIEVLNQSQTLHHQMYGANAAATDGVDPFGHLVAKVAGLEHRTRLILPLLGRQTARDSLLAIAENLAVFSIHSK